MFARLFFVSIVGLSAIHARADLLIDDFTSGPTTLSGLSASLTQPGLPVLGGDRAIAWNGVIVTDPPAPVSAITMTVDASNGGSFIYNGSPNRSATNFQLRYSGRISNPPKMNVDLGAYGDTIAIDFASANFLGGHGNFDIVLNSESDTMGGLYKFVRVDNTTTPFTLLVPLGGPNPPYGNTLDIHHITELSIGTANGNLPGSFVITSIRAVPEPMCALFAATFIPYLMGRAKRNRYVL
jgi:hypothetical protein